MYPLHIAELDAILTGAVHDKPHYTLTIEQAHAVMRAHVTCRALYCGCKGAAFERLVEEGRIIPDPDRVG